MAPVLKLTTPRRAMLFAVAEGELRQMVPVQYGLRGRVTLERTLVREGLLTRCADGRVRVAGAYRLPFLRAAAKELVCEEDTEKATAALERIKAKANEVEEKWRAWADMQTKVTKKAMRQALKELGAVRATLKQAEAAYRDVRRERTPSEAESTAYLIRRRLQGVVL